MAEVNSHVSPPQKLSRYRSVRAAAQQQSPPPPSDTVPPLARHDSPPEAGSIESAVARSRSRYKRAGDANRPVTARDVPRQSSTHSSSAQSIPTLQRAFSADATPSITSSPVENANHTAVKHPHAEETRERDHRYNHPNRSRSKPQGSPTAPVLDPITKQSPRNDRLGPPSPPNLAQPLQPPAGPNGPPLSNQIRATKSLTHLPRTQDAAQDDAGCFAMFKKKRADPSTSTEGALSSPQSPTPRDSSTGWRGAAAGIDAPVSAVNAGDRHVLVQCGQSQTMFPVALTTSALDLVTSAALCMSEQINVKSAILLESFASVGVQRPLRRYEHIRDVMNSWDNDRENTLLIVQPEQGRADTELTVAGAPRDKPGDLSWTLLFSQKPGKWDKRLITLRTDGQLIMQKDASKSRDVTNVCHLSDFDIYTPTAEKERKKIKPPKRICYAIKSQQKTSIFESTQNFVHFFSTGDKATGDAFYTAVQGWRSWYLVNVLGEGRKTRFSRAGGDVEKQGLLNSAKLNSTKSQHRSGDSAGSKYQLGSFRPLMDLEKMQLDSDADVSLDQTNGLPPTSPVVGINKSVGHFDASTSLAREPSRAKRQQPSTLLTRGPQLAEDEPLANLSGLPSAARDQHIDSIKARDDADRLARTYSQRQREGQIRNASPREAFFPGATLLSSPINATSTSQMTLDPSLPRRNPSNRAPNTSGISRQSSSARRPPLPPPLVDLTPTYRPPPQHARKGRAFVPSTSGPGESNGPLIESATSPDDPLGLPPDMEWRATATSTAPSMRAAPQSGMKPGSTALLSNVHEETPFVPGSLLAGGRMREGGRT